MDTSRLGVICGNLVAGPPWIRFVHAGLTPWALCGVNRAVTEQFCGVAGSPVLLGEANSVGECYCNGVGTDLEQ